MVIETVRIYRSGPLCINMPEHQSSYPTLQASIFDMSEILEHTTSTWGKFKSNEGRLGCVDQEEIPRIASNWVQTCETALRGGDLAKQAVEEGTMTVDTSAVFTFDMLTEVLTEEKGFEEKMETIRHAKKGFASLVDLSFLNDVTQDDIDAVQRLIEGLSKHFGLTCEHKHIYPQVKEAIPIT